MMIVSSQLPNTGRCVCMRAPENGTLELSASSRAWRWNAPTSTSLAEKHKIVHGRDARLLGTRH